MDRVGNGYRLCVLNGWVGDKVTAGITDLFGVIGENDNGRRVEWRLLGGRQGRQCL